jgi:hypothetical protein
MSGQTHIDVAVRQDSPRHPREVEACPRGQCKGRIGATQGCLANRIASSWQVWLVLGIIMGQQVCKLAVHRRRRIHLQQGTGIDAGRRQQRAPGFAKFSLVPNTEYIRTRQCDEDDDDDDDDDRRMQAPGL